MEKRNNNTVLGLGRKTEKNSLPEDGHFNSVNSANICKSNQNL